MKKLFYYLSGLLFFGFTLCSCNDEPGGDDYSGSNKVYLSVDNEAVITENDTTPLTVTVDLTTTRTEMTSLTFAVLDDDKGVLRLTGNPVSIEPGKKQATFNIVSNNKNLLEQEARFRIALSTFPQDIQLAEVLEVVVKPNPAIPQLTEEQKTLIEGYKEKYGIDLLEWIGIVNCKTTVNSPADGYTQDFVQAFTKEFTGYSIFTLSEKATAEKPILKITENPFGLTEYLYWVLRKETVENSEYWTQTPSAMGTMQLISWDKDSKESFSVTLDSLVLNDINENSANVDFVKIGEDEYGDPTSTIPFTYSFSAWDRMKELIDQGNAEAIEYDYTGGSANPTQYLFISPITYDCWEVPENYLSPKMTFDFKNKKLNCQFVFDHPMAGGYTRITVEYQLP